MLPSASEELSSGILLSAISDRMKGCENSKLQLRYDGVWIFFRNKDNQCKQTCQKIKPNYRFNLQFALTDCHFLFLLLCEIHSIADVAYDYGPFRFLEIYI